MSRMVVRQINKHDSTTDHKETNEEYNLYALETPSRKQMTISVIIESRSLEMEKDTGADVPLVSEEIYFQLSNHRQYHGFLMMALDSLREIRVPKSVELCTLI